MIYLDNAATSWPKPPEVLQAISKVFEQAGGNPGRSGHRLSIEAARIVYDCRESLSAFFNNGDPLRVIFTSNATHAINLALKGMLKSGDRVVTTAHEHNAVMRPLRFLERQGIRLDIIACHSDGLVDPASAAALIVPGVRLVVINHAGNVSGTVQELPPLIELAHRAGALVLVDASQSGGLLPIDMQKLGIDLLAFTGHKELLGPTGTGGLIINRSVDMAGFEPLIQGGTGSRSDSEYQPEELPDKFEGGTANVLGIAGLQAALGWIRERGQAEIVEHARHLTRSLIAGLAVIPGVRLYGTLDSMKSVAIVSITIDNRTVSDIGLRLDDEFSILTRVGLHCAPAAHRTLGTLPQGTVRLSPGIFTTQDDIDQVLRAIAKVART